MWCCTCGAVLCTLLVSHTCSYLDGVVIDQDSLFYTVQLQQLVLGLITFQICNMLAIVRLGNQTGILEGSKGCKSLTVTIRAKKLESVCLA